MKTKGKLKKNIGRFGRMQLASKEPTDSESPDLSQLRKPIGTNLCSLRQIAALFEKGSDEVKSILSYECDVVYECRICRSLFRSLANFISHKRVYCTQKYDVTLDRRSMDPMNSICNGTSLPRGDASAESEYKENCTNDRILRSQSTRKEPKKDLTSVVDMLMKKQNDDRQQENSANGIAYPLRISSDSEQVLLEIMDSNQAAYQTVLAPEIPVSADTDLMKNQTLELKNMLSRNTAVLGPDGQLLKVENISRTDNQSENAEDARMNLISGVGTELTCSACNASFATKKTLTFHVKSKHMAHQVNYLCPCCTSIFTNRASVHRHLVKVHRKSNEQMRKLRSQIQPMKLANDEIATTKSNEVSYDIESTEDSENLIIAQEWMQNLELDTELQRCGACGKRFDRSAALVWHSQLCPKRVAGARNESTSRHKRASKMPPQRVAKIDEQLVTNPPKNPPERADEIVEPAISESPADDQSSALEIPVDRSSSLKIEIQDWQMPEEQPKSPSISINRLSEKTAETSELSLEIDEENHETSIRVEGVSSLSKDVWDKIGMDPLAGSSESYENPTSSTQKSPRILKINKNSSETAERSLAAGTSDVPEVIYTSIDNSRPVTLSVLNTEKKLGIQYRGIRLPTVTLEKINIPRRVNPIEPNVSVNVSADRAAQIDKKLSSLANIRKLQCLPCNRKFVSMINLRRHIAVHLKRNRYRCKLCDFKAFLKCECIAHCNKKHNALNNRAILADLVIEMPPNSDFSESCKFSKSNASETRDELEVIDVTFASTSKEKTEKSPMGSDKPDNREEIKKNLLRKKDIVAEETNVIYPKGKPKRGRPPKKRRKPRGKQNVRAKHVSPPTLSGEFSDCDESGDVANSKESHGEQSSANNRSLRRRAPSRMDCDPELRKMVMEVIFGTTDKEIAESSHAKKNEMGVEEIDVVCERILDNSEIDEYSEIAVNNNGKSETIDRESKNEDIDIEISSVNDTDSDFHYDLKAVAYPKNVVLLRSPIAVEAKTLTSRSLVKLQTHDSQCDNKFPAERQLIIYDDSGVNAKLTDMQQSDIVFCTDK